MWDSRLDRLIDRLSTRGNSNENRLNINTAMIHTEVFPCVRFWDRWEFGFVQQCQYVLAAFSSQISIVMHIRN